jgi:hypothetical protein
MRFISYHQSKCMDGPNRGKPGVCPNQQGKPEQTNPGASSESTKQAANVIANLTGRGLQLRVVNNQLQVSDPSKITQQDRDLINKHRQAIMQLVADKEKPKQAVNNPKIPKNQPELLAKIKKEAGRKEMDSMLDPDDPGGARGVKIAERKIPVAVAKQFDAHGITSTGLGPLHDLTELLNNGVDPKRHFHSANLANSLHSEQSNLYSAGNAIKDTGPFVVLSHPGKTIKNGGIGGVLVDDIYASSIPDLQQAFPSIKFVAARDAAKILSKVAPPGGKEVSYGDVEPPKVKPSPFAR